MLDTTGGRYMLPLPISQESRWSKQLFPQISVYRYWLFLHLVSLPVFDI